MYLVDANIFKHLASNSEKAFIKNIQNWWKREDIANIYVSVATIMEQRRGIEKLREDNPQTAEKLQRTLDDLIRRLGARVLDVDLTVALEWGRLDRNEEKAEIDGAIAATANLRGFAVVTRDEKDFFRKRNVRIFNPSSANAKIREPK